MKEKLLISACLLGIPCRYDGKDKKYDSISRLKDRYDLIPICPEVMGGLKTPRLPCEISHGKAIRSDGQDMTTFYNSGAQKALETAVSEGCRIAVLKEKSPSCGTHFRYDGTFSKTLIKGEGITAKLFRENRIKVFPEDEIDQLL